MSHPLDGAAHRTCTLSEANPGAVGASIPWRIWIFSILPSLFHVCVCVCVCVCQRKTKYRADGMREKSAHCPRRDSNLYLWDTRPSCFRLDHDSRHASRQSKQTLQTLTRQLDRETIMHETLQLLSAGPRRQASARTSAESDEACQRKTKDVSVCVTMKKVPDERQARQATPAIFQVSSSKHNTKKITTRERGPFHQSITAILTEEKREEK